MSFENVKISWENKMNAKKLGRKINLRVAKKCKNDFKKGEK